LAEKSYFLAPFKFRSNWFSHNSHKKWQCFPNSLSIYSVVLVETGSTILVIKYGIIEMISRLVLAII
jgi:hypothetical protein